MDKYKDNKDIIKNLWDTDINFIDKLTSEELFILVTLFINDEEIRKLIERDKRKIIYRCGIDYDMYNYFTLLTLKIAKISYEECEKLINSTIKEIFSSKSIIMLLKEYKNMITNGLLTKEELFKKILDELETKETDVSSVILFDFYIFPDFNLYLQENHRIISTLIECYQLYDIDVISSKIFKGSTIIGKLLKNDNEQIAAKYLRNMLGERQISSRNIKMIGGGSTCLVFKIRDLVIKFGETRHNRKIYINHRILASLLRKLEHNINGEDLFYVEIMKYALVGDVTEEERDELKKDLYDQGLIWDDDKLENCGLLVDGDENINTLPVDYIEVAGNIDNPYRREEFMKRKRKVVVIDNDNIRFNPMKSNR